MSVIFHLNLEYPGLEEAGYARQDGQIELAEEIVLGYFQSRRGPAWYAPVGADADLEAAELVLQRDFTFQNRRVRLSEPLDWKANPVGDPEWTYFLNRHGYFGTLLKAYIATGDERYAADLDLLINSWCRNCPRPEERVRGEVNWRSIEAGIRLFSWWIPVWQYLQPSASFRRETRLLMLEAFAEHAWVLQNLGAAGGNWVLMESNGLAHLATYFPEFRDAPRWMEQAKRRLEAEVSVQVLPDGGQVELSTTYHIVSLRNFLHVLALPGYEPSPAYRQTLHRMFDWLEALQRPDGTLPMLQDADEQRLPVWGQDVQLKTEPWAAAVPEEFRRRMEHAPVPERSGSLPDSGYYVMRAPNRYLLADAGPFGYGHQHEDKLSVDVWAEGAPLIVDPGRYIYNRDRLYFLSTGAHSTVLVDGQGQNRRAGAVPGQRPDHWWKADLNPPVTWESGEEADLLDALYDEGYGPDRDRTVAHRRRILFVKPRCWLVVDDLLGAREEAGRERTFEQLWHLRPGPASLDPERGAAWTADGGRGNVLILGSSRDVRIVTGGPGTDRTDVLQGWYSPEYGIRQEAPLVVYRAMAGVPHRMVTLLWPFGPGAPPAVTLTREAAADSVGNPAADSVGNPAADSARGAGTGPGRDRWRISYPGGEDLFDIGDDHITHTG